MIEMIIKYAVLIVFVSLNLFAQETFLVTKMVDGDTFEIDTSGRVRLLGKEEFLEAQRQARENILGLWGNIDFEEM